MVLRPFTTWSNAHEARIADLKGQLKEAVNDWEGLSNEVREKADAARVGRERPRLSHLLTPSVSTVRSSGLETQGSQKCKVQPAGGGGGGSQIRPSHN